MAEAPTDAKPARAMQKRTAETRARITGGVIEVLARHGAAGCTHRAVAKAAGVSLAATTYHFDSKAAMIEAASQALLNSYVADFDRFAARLASGEARGVATLGDFADRVVRNATGRERIRSLAWCEIMLEGGRDPARRSSVAGWYAGTDRLWLRIARLLDPDAGADSARRAVDQVVGLTFLLHPMHPSAAEVAGLLDGSLDFDRLLDRHPAQEPPQDPNSPARQRVIDATIALLIDTGVAGITHRSVAERAGLARSAPTHHFASLDALIEAAQRQLFARAKARYRDAFADAGRRASTPTELLDLTNAVFQREAHAHAAENGGFYSVWVVAAQAPDLRGVVAAAQRDQHRGWCRRLSDLGIANAPALALRMQAQFIGMLIRIIAGGPETGALDDARAALADILPEFPK